MACMCNPCVVTIARVGHGIALKKGEDQANLSAIKGHLAMLLDLFEGRRINGAQICRTVTDVETTRA